MFTDLPYTAEIPINHTVFKEIAVQHPRPPFTMSRNSKFRVCLGNKSSTRQAALDNCCHHKCNHWVRCRTGKKHILSLSLRRSSPWGWWAQRLSFFFYPGKNQTFNGWHFCFWRGLVIFNQPSFFSKLCLWLKGFTTFLARLWQTLRVVKKTTFSWTS